MATPVLFLCYTNMIEQKGEMGMSRNKTYANISYYLIGAGCAILVCLAGLAILAHTVLTGQIGENGVNIAVPILLMFSTVIGGQLSQALSKKPAHMTLVPTGLFITAMVILSLLMDGAYRSVGLNIGALAVGTMISWMLCLRNSSKIRRKKKHYR